MSDIRVRPAIPSDRAALSHLRHALWPNASVDEHATELASLLTGKWPGAMPLAIFVAETPARELVGFAEVDLRSHADGCDPQQPVGYLEGWFVAEGHRRTGVG
ncbi:MAG TPA: GNAT family N-acetyltransferase, partial [Thermoanaerobaculia bacterium]